MVSEPRPDDDTLPPMIARPPRTAVAVGLSIAKLPWWGGAARRSTRFVRAGGHADMTRSRDGRCRPAARAYRRAQ